MPTLYTRRKYIDLVVAFKILHRYLNINRTSVGPAFSTLPTHSYCSNVRMQRPSTRYVSRSHNYRIIHIWNSWLKEYKYYKKVHLLFGLLKNVLRRILLLPCSRGKENTRCPMRNAQRAGAKISHPMRVRGVYFR